MNSIRWFFALLVLFSMMLLPARAESAAVTPADVTQKVYQISLDNLEGFSLKSIESQKPWLTDELYSRIEKKLNQPKSKDEAPKIEGDIFLDCQEPPATFKVGSSTIKSTDAKVEVTLIWPSEERHLNVLLKQVGGAWKINDVVYDKDGRLSDLLK